MKLTPIEEDILQTIQRHFPNSWKEVRDVYEEMKSIDDTIKILEHSTSLGIDVISMISIIKSYKS